MSALSSDSVRRAVKELWRAASAGDERAATEAAFDALAGGMDPETLLLDVVAVVQRRIGGEWAANRLTVAREHAATAVNDRVIAAVSHRARGGGAAGSGTGRAVPTGRSAGGSVGGPHGDRRDRPGRRDGSGTAGRGSVTVACVDGEWHALPARLLAEVLTLRGWDVDYLGAQVPTSALIQHLHRTGPDVVALSGSIATRLPTAHAAITACQAVGIPVLVGGAAFGEQGRYARLLGADAWASDARTAADRQTEALAAGRRDPHQRTDDLPHLADQEYTLISRAKSQLVKALLTGLEDRVPAMASYTELQRHHTAEDLAHIIDFLAAALYVDDDELFSGFLTWTAGVLTARGVPAATLPPTLDLLAAELTDFPRALRVISHARALVTSRTAPAADDGEYS
jgi:methanogenic corrinoid protein MtbC1